MSQPELIMLRGLPASGKTTWAKAYISNNPNCKRVNKDDLREMLDNSFYSKQNEATIHSLQNSIIITLLKKGYTVIVDNTHLKLKHQKDMENIAEMMGAKFTIKSFLDVSLDVCLERNVQRAKIVPVMVMFKMYENCDFLNNKTRRE